MNKGKKQNALSGTCYRCGYIVKAMEGTVEHTTAAHMRRWPKKSLGRYMIEHKECAEQFNGTNIHYLYQPMKKD